MRILGLDFGSKTVGVAVTDPLGITAQGVEIVRRDRESKLRKTLARINEIIEEYQVEEIVLGCPLNMDETEGERVRKTLEFKKLLEDRTHLTVHLQDERLTTVAADEILEEAGVRKADRSLYIDKVAAVLILEDFLNNRLETEKK